MANPFDDDNFGSNSRKNMGLDAVKSYTNSGCIEDEVVDYEREIEKYLQKSLDSTGRSRQQLENSEQLANSTARDLLEQREKLERTEKNLDEIHRTTQLTQRSLNSLKSVFGGFFKNKFSKAPSASSAEKMNPSKSDNQLSKVIETSSMEPSSSSNSLSGGKNNANITATTTTLSASSRANIKGTRWEAMDDEIDNNLDEMSSQLARLRTLGSALGDEVEDQNRLLDKIHQKAERNDAVVRHQDNQMRTLLGYKD